MKIAKRKCSIVSDLGKTIDLQYQLHREKSGYRICITSITEGVTEQVCAKDLRLGFFSAMRFFMMLYMDRVTPVTLQDILDDKNG